MITRIKIRNEGTSPTDCTFTVHADGAVTFEFDDGRDPLAKAMETFYDGKASAAKQIAKDNAAAAGKPEKEPGPTLVPKEETGTEPSPEEEGGGDGDGGEKEEAAIEIPDVVDAIGKIKASKECKEMEGQLAVPMKVQTRQKAGVPEFTRGPIHGRWDADDLNKIHAHLCAVTDGPTPEPAPAQEGGDGEGGTEAPTTEGDSKGSDQGPPL